MGWDVNSHEMSQRASSQSMGSVMMMMTDQNAQELDGWLMSKLRSFILAKDN